MARGAVRTILGLARLIRLRSTLTAPALTLIGWFDLGSAGLHAHPATVVVSTLSSFAMMAFAQTFNDVRDRDLDAATKPDRPIPAGLVSASTARRTSFVLAAATMVTAVAAGVATALLAAGCLVLAVAYSVRMKSTVLLGNVVVAVVASATLVYGSVSAAFPPAGVLIGQVVVFVYVFGNELFKTAVDRDGDLSHGCRTIATTWGLPATARFIMVSAVALAAVDLLAGPLRLVGPAFLLWYGLGVAVPTSAAALTLRARRRGPSAALTRAHVLWRLAWTPGVVALLLLR